MATSVQTRRGRRRSTTGPSRLTVSAGEFGRERFRFTLRRDQRRLPALDIDPNVETANWERDRAVRSGSLAFRKPLTGMQAAAIVQGDRVLCEVDLRSDGRWQRLWMLTVDDPEEQVAEGAVSLNLKVELKALSATRTAFAYRNKTAREITLELAARFHVQVGYLPAAGYKIPKLIERSASPVDVLDRAWDEEYTHTGRKFNFTTARGLIDVTELAEPKTRLVIGEDAIDADLKRELSNMTSAIIVKSEHKVGGRTRKIQVKVTDAGRLRRYGYVVRTVEKAGLDSEATARRYARQQLARVQKPTGELTFSHPGLPFLDAGAVIELHIPHASFDEQVFVKSTSHTLSAGSYTMDVTVAYADPWVDVRKERAKKLREQAARRRNRAGATASAQPTTAKAARRS